MTTVPADDPEVLENDYTSINDTGEDNYATIDKSKSKVEMQPIPETKPPEKETNGLNSHANNVSTSKPSEDVKSSGGAKPFLPKIFIALLIVLLIAVIALSFVLYRLDQDVSSADKKAKEADKNAKKADKKANDVDKKVGTVRISVGKVDGKINEAITAKLADLKDLEQTLRNKLEQRLQGKINTSEDEIQKNEKAVEEEQSQRKKDLGTLTAETQKVKDFVTQLNMKIQYNEPLFKGKLHEDFKDILARTGQKDFVVKPDQLLQGLLGQVTTFDETYKEKWGIEYEDVLRLTVENDKNVLKKIEALCSTFDEEFKKKWGIVFKDVIKLTKKEDMKAITMTLGRYVYTDYPPVLKKIDYLYKTFNETYNTKWHITFKDVIALTDTIDFKVGEKDIKVLTMIDTWYGKDFKEIWGNSFHEYFDVIKGIKNITHRTDIIRKMAEVSEKGALRFLPAKFQYDKEQLSLYGFVEVILNSTLRGTIRKGGLGETTMQDNVATVACAQGGYASGKYDKGKYNIGDVNRTSLNCLIHDAKCYGTEKTLPGCKLTFVSAVNGTASPAWDHKEDAGFKCLL